MDKQVSQAQKGNIGQEVWRHTSCRLESVESSLSFSANPNVLSVSHLLSDISWLPLSLKKTYQNLPCQGERGHWKPSRCGYLLTNIKVSSFTFGSNRLSLIAYHGPYSMAGAGDTAVKGCLCWRNSHRALSRWLSTYREAGAGIRRRGAVGGGTVHLRGPCRLCR